MLFEERVYRSWIAAVVYYDELEIAHGLLGAVFECAIKEDGAVLRPRNNRNQWPCRHALSLLWKRLNTFCRGHYTL